MSDELISTVSQSGSRRPYEGHPRAPAPRNITTVILVVRLGEGHPRAPVYRRFDTVESTKIQKHFNMFIFSLFSKQNKERKQPY